MKFQLLHYEVQDTSSFLLQYTQLSMCIYKVQMTYLTISNPQISKFYT